MPSLFTLEGAPPTKKRKRRRRQGLGDAVLGADGCKCVRNPRTGQWRKTCPPPSGRGRWKFVKGDCR